MRASFLTIAASAVLAGGAVAYHLLWEPHGGEGETARQDTVQVRQDIVQETDFLSANPNYLEGVRSYITKNGFSCPQIVHLWYTEFKSLIGPKLEAFCESQDPNALHYAVYPDDHDAVAWSNAEDFEVREAARKNNEWASKQRAESQDQLEERNKLQRQLCQMASACDRYNQARLDCAAAGNLKSCILMAPAERALYRSSRGSGKKPNATGVQVIWKATNDYRIGEALLLLGFTG